MSMSTKEFKELCTSARNGSIESLGKLASEAARPSPSNARAMTKVFCDVLRTIDGGSALGKIVISASTSLLALKDLQRHTFKYRDVNEAFRQAWISLSNWFSSIIDHESFTTMEGFDRLPFLECVDSALEVFVKTCHSDRRHHPVECDEVCILIFRLWMQIGGTAKEGQVMLSAFRRCVPIILPSQVSSRFILKAATHYGVGGPAVIDKAISRLQHCQQQLSTRSSSDLIQRACDASCASTFVLHCLLVTNNQESLRPSGSAIVTPSEVVSSFRRINFVVLKLLQKLLAVAEAAEHDKEHTHLLGAAEECIHLIVSMLDFTPDISIILATLRRGLMTAILNALNIRPWKFQPKGIRIIKQLLSRTLPRNLIFRSVTIAVRDAVKVALEVTNGPPDSNSPLGHDWSLFQNLLDHSTWAVQLFSKNRREELVSCGNQGCLWRGPRKEFKMCAGCRATVYCSKACQMASWRNQNHKRACSNIRRTHEESGLDANDVWFLSFLAVDETRRKLPKFANGSDPRVAGVALERRGYIVKFSALGPEREYIPFDLAKLQQLSTSVFTESASPAETFLTSYKFTNVPRDPREKYIPSKLLVQYHVGTEARELYFSVAFTRTDLEGKGCSCCFCHGNRKMRAHEDEQSCIVHKH